MKLKNIAYAAFIAVAAAAFVIGSGGSSEAKGKKMAPPPPHPGPCFDIAGPVCGVKGGMKFTYANACYAAEGRRQGGFARRLPESQGAQEGRQEESGQAGEENGKEVGHEEAGGEERRQEEDVTLAGH